MTPEKRVMNYLSVAERVAVIHEYDVVPNVPYLARRFRCGRRQIRNILRRREEYLDEWRNNPDPRRMPRRQPSRVKAVNTVLYACIQRLNTVDIADDYIRDVGQRIADSLSITEFRADKRWIERFKKKYKIAELVDNNAMKQAFGDDEEKQPLNISQVIEEMMPDIASSIIRHPTVDKTCTNPRRQTNSTEVSTSENSNEPIEYIDILTDSCHSNDDSSDNLLEESKSNGNVRVSNANAALATLLYNDDDAIDSTTNNMADFFPNVELTVMPAPVKPITSYKEALNHLGPLEQFVLLKENIRAIGLINQIENIFRDEMEHGKL